MRLLALLTALILSVPLGAAEIAVIPYRIEDPSAQFDERTGEEYAKLLGLALALKKGMRPYSPRELEIDMRSFSIDPRRSLSAESLNALGRGRYIDLILTGTLSRVGGLLISESVLYSPAQGRVLARERTQAENLFALVERDVRGVFVTYPDRAIAGARAAAIDAAVVLDASYAMSGEWEPVKRGIEVFASAISGGWEASLRLYITPFSDRKGAAPGPRALGSPLSLKRELASITPKAAAGPGALGKALVQAVDGVPWRDGAVRVLLVVSNSPIRDTALAERMALKARKKGIAIYTVPLGRIGGEEAEAMRQMAITGRGRSLPAAYRQRVYDTEGKAIDVFMQSGRLFHARDFGGQWKGGLFVEGAGGRLLKPKPFLSELFFDEKRHDVTPYTMGERYADIAGARIINRERLESNVESLLRLVGEGHGSSSAGAGRAAAKALLTEDGLSIWIHPSDPALAGYLEKQSAEGRYITLGVTVRMRPDEPYGFDFSPRSIITGIELEQIPGMALTSLREIMKNPGYYTANGLFAPPVWFVRVRVERVERLKNEADIRD